MKLLKDILYGCRIAEVNGSTHVAVEDVAFDSRAVKPFGVFVAVPGTKVDGHDYIPQALERGAIAVVAERLPEERAAGVTYVQVHDAAKALGRIAAGFYDHPSREMRVVAVTGTNGKTTTVTLLHQLFRGLDRKTGMLSTVENRINDTVVPSTHTTPDAVQMQRLFRKMVDAGCKYCFMEASSHSIHQHRLAGTELAGAVFSNITHDHLDYHGTFNHYLAAKRGLFDGLGAGAFALINRTRGGEVFALRLRPAGVMLLGAVSVASVADATVPATDPLTLGLLRTIAEGTTNEQRVALADRALTAMLDTGPDSELLLANAALDLLSEGVRSRTVPDLARELGVSARTVQRALHRTLGQGPRWVARWVRLQEVARLISVDDVPDLAQSAATLGYVDQAHLTRDFRAAAGTTPGAYARSLRRLAGG